LIIGEWLRRAGVSSNHSTMTDGSWVATLG
jgi:hypothetical protein